MAQDKQAQTADPTPQAQPQTSVLSAADFEVMGQVIGDAVAAGITKSGRRKVGFGEYLARGGYSPFHKDKEPKLKRNYFQNGYRLNASTLTDKECELLERITHSGRYIERKVEVLAGQNGDDIDIRFNCASPDQRFELAAHVRNFTDMLTQIVEAQELEDLEEDDRRKASPQRRHFGDNQASRDARAKAQ